jgi:hypothetical protein
LGSSDHQRGRAGAIFEPSFQLVQRRGEELVRPEPRISRPGSFL